MDFEKAVSRVGSSNTDDVKRKQHLDLHHVLVRSLKRPDPSLICLSEGNSGSTSILETL
jgi:hypothetical protein